MSFSTPPMPVGSVAERYVALRDGALALFDGERDAIANAANLSSLIWHSLPELNWVGFYFWKSEQLVLGPFQGKVACVRIEMGEGVCGRAAQDRRTLIVADVHTFEGHIACDPDSRAEIVVPLMRGDRLLGVLDLDSPRRDRFVAADAQGLEALAQAWVLGSEPLPTC